MPATGRMEVQRLPVEVMLPETFAPFGWIIDAPRDAAPEFVGVATRGWSVPFELAGRIQVSAIATDFAGFRFSKLERHLQVTQMFIPLHGPRSLLAVAVGPEAGGTPAPPAKDVRAFWVDKSQGYVLRRGTWHSLDRYPLHPPAAAFAMITEAETTEEFSAGGELSRSDVFDYAAAGIEFEFDVAEAH